ncbi:hypothetical protein AWC26_10775 [Mycobacterium shimoidei]|nr:hypothetical protein BHQ16_05100 [Mycobacterium shimoidei]ORW80379.1 hypothetical protein AWC26_10775 [Mycobacterium shimoidei]
MYARWMLGLKARLLRLTGSRRAWICGGDDALRVVVRAGLSQQIGAANAARQNQRTSAGDRRPACYGSSISLAGDPVNGLNGRACRH